ncbi:hypothetical protein ACG02S_12475 [Roseateles sp. DC23W]|uniref:Caspase domain-containing protein n=1 Tax=Pelomonas dachongensis TaxID=3299029 RepID=A0ABW7EQ14_9BURK
MASWIRDVDAGEFALIIDACHSDASVASPGFRPGPLGTRGLGQLAYDKGTRILAASQAEDVAAEDPSLKHGLLTFALMQGGLASSRADFKPADKSISLEELLAYGRSACRCSSKSSAAASGPAPMGFERQRISACRQPIVGCSGQGYSTSRGVEKGRRWVRQRDGRPNRTL